MTRRSASTRSSAGGAAWPAGTAGREDVAEQAGITPQFLSSVERGKKGMTGMNIANLARALNVTADYLLYGRTDADAAWVGIAEHLASLTPAMRDMAAENAGHHAGHAEAGQAGIRTAAAGGRREPA